MTKSKVYPRNDGTVEQLHTSDDGGSGDLATSGIR
jgi:hypothetical protein